MVAAVMAKRVVRTVQLAVVREREGGETSAAE